jgi:hypothetical protein
MAGFDQAWLAVSGPLNGEPVSDRLRVLLEAVYQQVLADPINLGILKQVSRRDRAAREVHCEVA